MIKLLIVIAFSITQLLNFNKAILYSAVQNLITKYSVIIFGLRFAFFKHISGKKRTVLKICALKKRNDFRQLKSSNFRVEKFKTEENLSKFLNNMAYNTVTSLRDCVMKRKFM